MFVFFYFEPFFCSHSNWFFSTLTVDSSSAMFEPSWRTMSCSCSSWLSRTSIFRPLFILSSSKLVFAMVNRWTWRVYEEICFFFQFFLIFLDIWFKFFGFLSKLFQFFWFLRKFNKKILKITKNLNYFLKKKI